MPNSSIGTRTDAAIKDVPQSIQVIPQQVIKDQGETDFNDALRNVSGVSPYRVGLIFVAFVPLITFVGTVLEQIEEVKTYS